MKSPSKQLPRHQNPNPQKPCPRFWAYHLGRVAGETSRIQERLGTITMKKEEEKFDIVVTHKVQLVRSKFSKVERKEDHFIGHVVDKAGTVVYQSIVLLSELEARDFCVEWIRGFHEGKRVKMTGLGQVHFTIPPGGEYVA